MKVPSFIGTNSAGFISLLMSSSQAGEENFSPLVDGGICTAREIIFDFGAVNYISSAGLREILICRKKFPDMRIENVRDSVFKIFSMTGFDRLIAINQIADAPPKFDNVLNEFVGLENSSAYVHVSLRKFLRDKATYSAEKIVVVCAGEKFSWSDIDRCATIIAADLAEKNVCKGSHVAICGANSINRLLTFFAVQKLGAIAVLVNFNLSARETVKSKLQQIIRDDDPAVMIFTSGTTGKLKGVLLSSYNILNAAQGIFS